MEKYYKKMPAVSDADNFRRRKLSYLLILIILSIFLIFQSTTYAQQWRVFTTANSPLPSNLIGTIAIDSNNVKWVGTDNGLVKIDGNNWTIYDTNNTPLPENMILPRDIDVANNLWISTYSKGIAKFDGFNWIIYNSTNSGLPGNSVVCISIDRNNVKWIGTPGLIRFDDFNWTIYNTTNSGLPSNIVTTVAIEGYIKWIGTLAFTGGMAKFNDTNWVVYNTSNSGIPSNLIRFIRLDIYNNKWICTENGGLAKFNSTANSWVVYNTSNSGIPSDYCYGFVSMNNIKYIGGDEGIARFNDTTWQVFNTSNSPLPNNLGFPGGIDIFGNVWIATAGGLAIYNPDGIIGINNQSIKTPQNFKLHQNYPNPFNSTTNIDYELSKKSNIRLILYDVAGRTLALLTNKFLPAGKYKYILDSQNLSSGIYFYQLVTEYGSLTRKLILIK